LYFSTELETRVAREVDLMSDQLKRDE